MALLSFFFNRLICKSISSQGFQHVEKIFLKSSEKIKLRGLGGMLVSGECPIYRFHPKITGFSSMLGPFSTKLCMEVPYEAIVMTCHAI